MLLLLVVKSTSPLSSEDHRAVSRHTEEHFIRRFILGVEKNHPHPEEIIVLTKLLEGVESTAVLAEVDGNCSSKDLEGITLRAISCGLYHIFVLRHSLAFRERSDT